MSYLRIGLAIAAAVLVAWLVHRVSLSFTLGDEIAAKQDTIDALGAAAARDRRFADALGLFRGQQSDWSRQFHDDLTSKPLTIKVQPHVDPKTGAVAPCIVRDPVRYRELFNQALAGPVGVP